MSRLALALVAWLAAACASWQPDPRAAAIGRYLEALAAEGRFQGAVVVGDSGRVVYARGFGFADVEKRVPFTPDTANDGASITKTFTAAALLQLASEGRVDLEAPVQRYLPAYPHAATRVRHLISHGAGLPDYDWFDRFMPPPAVRTNADHVTLLAREARLPDFTPGTRFVYDNVAFDVAALVIERASGISYEGYLRERFFTPLAMRSAFVRPARLADFPGVRTVGYRAAGSAERFDAFEGEAFHGADNLYLSALDLHRWVSSFVTRPAIDAAALARVLERARLEDGRRTNLTLGSWYPADDGRRHYYVGHHNGFYDFAHWDRASGLTVAFVSNNNLSLPLGVALPRALIALAEGREPEAPPVVEGADPPEEAWSRPWLVEGVGTVTFRSEGRRRFITAPGSVELRMFRVAPGIFAVPGLEGWMRFHAEAGRPALLWDSIFRVARGAPG